MPCDWRFEILCLNGMQHSIVATHSISLCSAMKDSLRQNNNKKSFKKASSGTNSVSFRVYKMLEMLMMITTNKVKGADETTEWEFKC